MLIARALSPVVLATLAGCAGSLAMKHAATPCARVDSILARIAPRGVDLTGRTTIDVNEYRVRGRFHLRIDETGNLTLEFQSTSPMGGHREDVVVSWQSDTLRVFDRERGALYEGEEVDRLGADGLDREVDVSEIVRRILAGVTCSSFDDARVRDGGIEGRVGGERFVVRVRDGRVASSDWPAPLGGRGRERLVTDYRYRDGALRGITVRIPGPRWRVRLDGS